MNSGYSLALDPLVINVCRVVGGEVSSPDSCFSILFNQHPVLFCLFCSLRYPIDVASHINCWVCHYLYGAADADTDAIDAADAADADVVSRVAAAWDGTVAQKMADGVEEDNAPKW